MKDFTDILQRKFPTDGSKGFYVKPKMSATKLGKALMNYTQISSPADVVAFHEYGNFFSGGTIVFTGTKCFFSDGSFPLEDLRATRVREKFVDVEVNQGGKTSTMTLKTDGEQEAKLLSNVLDAIIYAPKAEDLLEEERNYEEEFDETEVNWLKLRDEVMRTIDMLHQRFQDGKITLVEFENTKTDLLSRL